MARKAVGVLGGVTLTLLLGLSLAKPSGQPWTIGILLPVLLGSVLAGYVIHERGWLYGLVVSILEAVFGIAWFYKMWGAVEPVPVGRFIDIWLRWEFFLELAMGPIGGLLGELLYRLRVRGAH